MLEKPPQQSRVDAPRKVTEKKDGEEKKEDRNLLLECAKGEVRHNSTSSSSGEEGEKEEEKKRCGTPHPESERNITERNGTEQNEMEWNETERNETELSDTAKQKTGKKMRT